MANWDFQEGRTALGVSLRARFLSQRPNGDLLWIWWLGMKLVVRHLCTAVYWWDNGKENGNYCNGLI